MTGTGRWERVSSVPGVGPWCSQWIWSIQSTCRWWGYRKDIFFVVPKEKKKMGSKEGMSVNLVIGRWNYCLWAAVFLTKFFKFCGKIVIWKWREQKGCKVIIGGCYSWIHSSANLLVVWLTRNVSGLKEPNDNQSKGRVGNTGMWSRRWKLTSWEVGHLQRGERW